MGWKTDREDRFLRPAGDETAAILKRISEMKPYEEDSDEPDDRSSGDGV